MHRAWFLLAALLLSGCMSSVTVPGHAIGAWQLNCFTAANWTDPCTVNTTPTTGPASENWLAVNPTDALNVVTGSKNFNDAASSCVWGGVSASHDGGRTWAEQYIGGTREQRLDPTHPLFGFQCVTDPMFNFDSEGLLYLVVEAYGRTPHERAGLLPLPPGALGPLDRQVQHPDTGGNTLFIAVSRDGGSTFGTPVRVWDGEGGAVDLLDKTFILANPASGSVHFATSQFTAAGTQILVFTSRDHGASWGQPVFASSLDDANLKFPAALSAARDGTLYLSWHDWNTNQVIFTSSADDGASFAPPGSIASTDPLFSTPPNAQFRVVTQPYHAVDNSGGSRDGALYMTWMQNVTGHMDVLWMRSTDRGATWTEPALLTDDAGTNAQYHTAIAVDDRGAVHVTYYDQRYDPGDRLVDLTWAVSEDGLVFAHRRITASSFDGDLGFHQDGFPFLGDYNGLGCNGDTCYASWADTRSGRSDVAVARMVRQ